MALITFSPSTTIKSADVNSNFTNLANGSAMTSPTIANCTLTTAFAASGEYNNGNSGASITINGANGDRQLLTVSAATTLSFSGFLAGQNATIRIVENGTGNFSITLPSGKWPYGNSIPFVTTPNAINLLSVYYDGTNYLYQLAPGYA